MMAPISFATLAHKYGGVLLDPDFRLKSLSIDSRTLNAGQVFLALKGDNFDGHEYLGSAVDQGASALVTEKVLPKKAPQWVVKNSLRALGYIAVENRLAFEGKLIALTGSNGKTSVKEMIASILRQSSAVLSTRGNLNNHIGVPLTMLGLSPEHEYAVIEMGASGLGEINYLTEMARPDVALVNNVGDAHIGEFGGAKNIEIGKGEIYNGLSSAGTGVVNLDSSGVERYTNKLIGRKMIGFSLENEAADVFASEIRAGESGSEFMLNTGASTAVVNLPVPGRHNVANALAAASCCLAIGIPVSQIVLGLEQFSGVQGRLQRHVLGNGALLIDDTYNASPSSVRAALDILAEMQGARILVLGDMGELGKDSEELHAQIGKYALNKGMQQLFTCGPLSSNAAQAFGPGAQAFEDKSQLIQALIEELEPDSRILVKGSRSSRMEKVVNALKEWGE